MVAQRISPLSILLEVLLHILQKHHTHLLCFSRSALSFISFGGNTGAPRHCLDASDLLEQGNDGLGKSYNRGWFALLV